MQTVIHWFRRDLRLADNPALHAASRAGHVIPLYIVSPWKKHHRWAGAPRQEFLCGNLRSLDANLRHRGSALVIRSGDPTETLLAVARESGATAIFAGRDYDPHGRATEARVADAARLHGIAFHTFKDRVIREPHEVLTSSGTMFRVFTPYSRAWLKSASPADTLPPPQWDAPPAIPSEPLPTLDTWGLSQTASFLPDPGENAARKRLVAFLEHRAYRYAATRNTPAADGTSRISSDLRFGTLSIREVYRRCLEASSACDAAGRRSIATFINELAWREFYFAVLWHWPEVLDHEWNPAWRGLRWDDPGERFELWCRGETGFPIVDAAMHQLNATGWMHNRLRMITAMFLTKDLHVDWRHGERYFMQRLTDGEIAANNGGWQWSAGTGADAAPYFRIQNPWTQTKTYDPDGTFIKTWLPVLRDVPGAKLCNPPNGIRLHPKYPLPIVDHARERRITLERFARHRHP